MREVVLLKSMPKIGGGFEKTALRIAGEFEKRGDHVTFLSPTKTFIPWACIKKFDRTVKKYLQTHPSDIVFGMDRNAEQTHFRAGNGSHHAFLKSRIDSEGRLKYLSCLLNPHHRKILSNEKKAFESPGLKKLFVNSHMVKNEILSQYSTDPQKISVIHNGVEWDELGPHFHAWSHHKNKSEFTLLFVGNGFLRKGLSLLLEALSLIKNPPKLLVVGKDKNQSRYELQAKKLSLPVQFFGPVTNIRPFYQAADALVIPSFYDPFANVTVEALAMGLFVVSSKSNGGSEILTPQTGHIIENLLSPDSIAQSLSIALNRPKTEISAEAIRNQVKHLDYSIQLKTLVDECYE